MSSPRHNRAPGGEAEAEGDGDIPVAAAARGGSVGGRGSACSLPVIFDFAESWKPHTIPKHDGGPAPFTYGSVSPVCEIDAKPAGHIGYLRVYTSDFKGENPRKALENFVTESSEKVKDAMYTEVRAGAFDAIEVAYVDESELLGQDVRNRALAFAIPQGVLVLELGGLDSEEHNAMRPAFELAKETLKAN
ncbi:lipoprotein [Streptomyces sp. CAU 1734]|uniref:lipoprotein n=1 Tax=Streptomyces sp. CAU 1734 TaxID=3140360 RepID=UPI0032601B4D